MEPSPWRIDLITNNRVARTFLSARGERPRLDTGFSACCNSDNPASGIHRLLTLGVYARFSPVKLQELRCACSYRIRFSCAKPPFSTIHTPAGGRNIACRTSKLQLRFFEKLASKLISLPHAPLPMRLRKSAWHFAKDSTPLWPAVATVRFTTCCRDWQAEMQPWESFLSAPPTPWLMICACP